jgi:hypothetical protein
LAAALVGKGAGATRAGLGGSRANHRRNAVGANSVPPRSDSDGGGCG